MILSLPHLSDRTVKKNCFRAQSFNHHWGGSIQWKSNLTFTTLLWIHEQNSLVLSTHDTIFSCKFSFKTPASGNLLIVSSSSQFSLGRYFYCCAQMCSPIKEGTWLLLLICSWLAAHFSETALTVWTELRTFLLSPERGKTTQEVECLS